MRSNLKVVYHGRDIVKSALVDKLKDEFSTNDVKEVHSGDARPLRVPITCIGDDLKMERKSISLDKRKFTLNGLRYDVFVGYSHDIKTVFFLLV